MFEDETLLLYFAKGPLLFQLRLEPGQALLEASLRGPNNNVKKDDGLRGFPLGSSRPYANRTWAKAAKASSKRDDDKTVAF